MFTPLFSTCLHEFINLTSTDKSQKVRNHQLVGTTVCMSIVWTLVDMEICKTSPESQSRVILSTLYPSTCYSATCDVGMVYGLFSYMILLVSFHYYMAFSALKRSNSLLLGHTNKISTSDFRFLLFCLLSRRFCGEQSSTWHSLPDVLTSSVSVTSNCCDLSC